MKLCGDGVNGSDYDSGVSDCDLMTMIVMMLVGMMTSDCDDDEEDI